MGSPDTPFEVFEGLQLGERRRPDGYGQHLVDAYAGEAPRSTDSVTRGRRKRTAAATEAVKRRRAQRVALELGARIGQLEDEWIVTLACVLVDQVDERNLREAMDRKWREMYG